MPRCFVIQPFDNGPFDRRYVDVLRPAIEAAGFEAYRVDQDPSSVIPIDTITAEIGNSDVCLADISEDNPNVWFEIGFALACNREVVLICSESRRTHFPFDVRHRTIIKYRTDSSSDFDVLSNSLKARLSAYAKSESAVRRAVSSSPIRPTDGLLPYEVAILVYLLENRLEPTDGESGYSIQQAVHRSGYTKAAISLGLERLRSRDYIALRSFSDSLGEPTSIYCLQRKGMDWLLENESKVVLTSTADQPKVEEYDPFADE